MEKLLRAVLVLMAVSGAAMSGAQAEAPRHWTAEEQAVIDAVSKGPVGIENDFDGWADGYAANWSYWRLGAPEIRERGAHMQLVREYIEGGARVVGFEMTPVDVIVHGDAALLRLNAVETIIEAEGGTRKVQYSSAGFLIKEDGEWRLAASNLYYPPADPE